jgi:hypothetical protein
VNRDERESVATGAVAIAWGLVVAVGAYALVRAVQSFLWPDPNPAALVWNPRAGFFWRVWTVAYIGGFAAFVAFVVAQGRRSAAARALAPAIAIAAALLALQSLFLP